MPPALLFFLRIALAILYLLVCHVNFRTACFPFCGLMIFFGIMHEFLYFGVL